MKTLHSSTPIPSPWKAPLAPLPLAGYAIFIGEAAFAPPNPMWAFLLLVWALGAALLAWWLAHGGARRIFDQVDHRHASSLAIGLIAGFIALYRR